jgi:hypothetical protein
MDIITELLNAIAGIVASIFGAPAPARSSPQESARKSGGPDRQKSARTTTASVDSTTVAITVSLPRARITWDHDEWRDSALEDVFDHGEVLQYQLANDVMSNGMPDADGAVGGGCWAASQKSLNRLRLPTRIWIVPTRSLTPSQMAISLASSNVVVAMSKALAALAVATIDLTGPEGAPTAPWYSGNQLRGDVTRTVQIPPGEYWVIAAPQSPESRIWCCPTKYWGWYRTGPQADKSHSWCRNHCTSHLTAFERTIYVGSAADYAARLTVVAGAARTQMALVQPLAQLRVGDRRHWESDYAKQVYWWCRLSDKLYDLILEKIFGS